MSKQAVTLLNQTMPEFKRVRKARPSPFIGAASIILGTGSVVLGVIGRALKGSVKLLIKSTDKRKIETPPDNQKLPTDTY